MDVTELLATGEYATLTLEQEVNLNNREVREVPLEWEDGLEFGFR